MATESLPPTVTNLAIEIVGAILSLLLVIIGFLLVRLLTQNDEDHKAFKTDIDLLKNKRFEVEYKESSAQIEQTRSIMASISKLESMSQALMESMRSNKQDPEDFRFQLKKEVREVHSKVNELRKEVSQVDSKIVRTHTILENSRLDSNKIAEIRSDQIKQGEAINRASLLVKQFAEEVIKLKKQVNSKGE